FNDTAVEYPVGTIHELFEEQVKKTPNHIAVVFEEKQLTYEELNKKANKLARTLREKGVAQNSIVAIMVDRSVEMIVGILGVLKAGGAYLPIDPEYPTERIEFMLEDSNADIIITQEHLTDKNGSYGEVVNIN
ncbi:AMP-binding protein, partial [Bacillus cereus]